MPVHCIVMNTSTPCYLGDVTHDGYGKRPASSSTGDVDDADQDDDAATVDVDSYAIIPAATLFTNVVPAVLRKLGYSDDVVFNATGTSHLHISFAYLVCISHLHISFAFICSTGLSLSLFLCLFICLSVYLFICLFIQVG